MSAISPALNGAPAQIAAMVGLARVFFVAFGGLRWDWQPVLQLAAQQLTGAQSEQGQGEAGHRQSSAAVGAGSAPRGRL